MADASVFRRRYSCRRFAHTKLFRGQLEHILEAAVWAPSAGNLQPWRFIVVTSDALKAQLAAAAHQDFVAEAPVVIVVCAVPGESARRYGERGRSLYCLQDTAAATQSILLAATELGLGSCWVGAFEERAAAAALGLPPVVRPVALIPVGQPLETPATRERRPEGEVVIFRG
ncbi:MAG TPA: nitroreductase family protein [Thermoanaerobaculaceae bacterium]|nr:nitroreductase family protein [Thermoanaerobaculaceae bacterium]